ncbi:MAG: hypothetical protein H0V97_04955 [Actinobacteria bacterium]|nr:hypothetical protein [Actinomycetota bacterium]
MAVSTPPRPDLEAHNTAMRLEFPVVVKELRELLGPRLVAYIAGVRETRTVGEWAEGAAVKRPDSQGRLRMAFHIAGFIAQHDAASVAQSWFQGLNPQLDDQSPARLLREEELSDVGPRVLAAARAFVVGG